jgi:hypothetical protein
VLVQENFEGVVSKGKQAIVAVLQAPFLRQFFPPLERDTTVFDERIRALNRGDTKAVVKDLKVPSLPFIYNINKMLGSLLWYRDFTTFHDDAASGIKLLHYKTPSGDKQFVLLEPNGAKETSWYDTLATRIKYNKRDNWFIAAAVYDLESTGKPAGGVGWLPSWGVSKPSFEFEIAIAERNSLKPKSKPEKALCTVLLVKQ